MYYDSDVMVVGQRFVTTVVRQSRKDIGLALCSEPGGVPFCTSCDKTLKFGLTLRIQMYLQRRDPLFSVQHKKPMRKKAIGKPLEPEQSSTWLRMTHL